MKYALVFLVAAVGFWLWLRDRSASGQNHVEAGKQKSPAKTQSVTPVVSCSVCGLHLPSSEALLGKRGSYCSEAHQRQVGD